MNKPRKQELGIDHKFEPWTRKWSGVSGYHPYKNQVGGAMSRTKRELTLEIEERNRKNKALRKKR